MRDEHLLEVLLREEHRGWEALRRGEGGAYYRNVMTPDGVMVVPGIVLDRASTPAAIDSAAPWDSYEITEPRVVSLGRDAAQLVYRVAAVRGEDTYEALLSTTFRRSEGSWRVAAHQHTPLPT
ncbi:conserved hypothetical protein [Beutenbergia cavernae DSM 12333]|uniref:DUF4440 domain-containing protein n=1 Tax=Beutenbergia cavernae (strain ATCC BAA-8 / DSM 12333 / CCUG 43141 / JCM 11478 / NBRC 16432 / NCIMB 13614 / HKI 0122) TaxID=471853 RepID=C5BVE7_BEUC1|nr:nuclear transport factor 2 family protein [Beutenbergia cavernae]ACQ80534.1 conserved hypothetical protein [Beutenbergia cavernae DSM 12333]